jgi:hypothetical protein
MAKLSKADVEYIKLNWLTSKTTDLSKKFNVSDKTIRNIARKFSLTQKTPTFQKEQRDNANHEALATHTETVGIPISDVKHYWHKSEHFSLFVGNKQISLWDIKEKMIEEMNTYSIKYPTIKYTKKIDAHLLVIDPADIHIGKLVSVFETGEEYDQDIAQKRVLDGVQGILNKAQGFNIDQILFIIGNDILHVDNAKSTTTSGTQQDTNIKWHDAYMIAFKLYVKCIEMIVTQAPITIQYDPSNHDYVTGFLLAQSLQSWFRKSENITFNITIAHRKYYKYHNNLIGTTHGDGAKETDLPMLMAHESEFWNQCKHRYFYTHHIHHKKSKDYMSVCVESLRSPSGTDSWHHRNGYQHAPKAVEGFLHHPIFGQVARFTHLF